MNLETTAEEAGVTHSPQLLCTVETAEFNLTHDYTEGDVEANEYYNSLMTAKVEAFMHLCINLGLESVTDEVIRTVPELKEALLPEDMIAFGMDYTRFANKYYETIKDLAPIVAVQKNKKAGAFRVKLPLLRFQEASNSTGVSSRWRYQRMMLEGDLPTDTYSAFALAFLRWSGNKPGAFIKDIVSSEKLLDDLFDSEKNRSAEPLDQHVDRELYDFFAKMIKGFEVRCAYTPPLVYSDQEKKRVPKVLEEGVSSENLTEMRMSPWILYVTVELPTTMAQWMTQSDDPDPLVVYQWYRQYLNGYMAGFKPTPPSAIRTLDRVVDETKEVREIKLSDDRGISVLFTGEIVHLPEVRDTAKYIEYQKSLDRYKVDNGTSIDFDPLRQIIETAPSDASRTIGDTNQALYTDWKLNSFSYLNGAGNTERLDLNGAKPGNPSVYMRLLNTPISDSDANAALSDLAQICRPVLDKDWADFLKVEDFYPLIPKTQIDIIKGRAAEGEALDGMMGTIGRILAEANLTYDWPQRISGLVPNSLMKIVRNIMLSADRRPELFDLDGPIDYSSAAGDEIAISDIFRWPGCQAIKRACDEIMAADTSKIGTSVGVERATRTVPYYALISSTDDPMKVIQADRDYRKQYREPVLRDDYVPLPVPNTAPDRFLLPHQVKADNHVKNDPDNMILAVRAGGGKTFLGLIDAARALQKGQQTAFIMPNYLVRNYLEDSAYLFAGKMNIFYIDNSIYSRLGEDELRRRITASPINTVFIFGLTVFSQGKNFSYNYDGDDITVNQIAEFFRSCGFKRVIIDEGHLLANSDSNRSRSIARGLGGVEKVRDMTGTFINSTVQDAQGQIRLMDPNLLKTDDEFNAEYAAVWSGKKVKVWQPRAEQKMARAIKSEISYVHISRKEWAALLPEREEQFHFVDLTENQREVYMSILTEVLRDLEEADPALAAKLREGNEEDAMGLETLLKRFLARVERFLASPDLDELGARTLKGKDLISKKIVKINEILADHFANPESASGKVLIFTSYRDSTESIYNNLDPKFKGSALLYTAERKEELIPRIKKDDSIKIVVGVEASLNTGHNFQMYNRLIRVETVWNPGTLDQAESRLNRPDPKNQSGKRAAIWYDWICTNNTIDVTKTARLISKLLSATKFEEAGSGYYDDLKSLDIVSMTYDNIMLQNDWEVTLQPYMEEYTLFQGQRKKDYENYLANTPFKEVSPIVSAGVIKGSAYMKMPYVPGMVLPFQEEIGLESLTDYALDLHLGVTSLTMAHLKDRRVHTEFGDGAIVATSGPSVRVELKSGEKVSVPKGTAFLIPSTFRGDIESEIIKRVGLPVQKASLAPAGGTGMNVVKQIDDEEVIDETEAEDGTPSKKVKKPVPNTDVTLNKKVQAFPSIINNTLSISLNNDDPDVDKKLMKRLDMTWVEPYYFAWIKTATHFHATLEHIQKKFKIPADQLASLEAIGTAFEGGRQKLFKVDQADVSTLRHFMLEGRKTQKPDTLFLYPHVEDGFLYLCAWADQVSARKLPSMRGVPGVRFTKEDGYYAKYFRRKSEAKNFVASLETMGIEVTNMKDVNRIMSKLVFK